MNKKLVKITGTAEPHTEVFVFSLLLMRKDFLKGTCFSAGESDKFGYFSLELNPRLLWGNIGDTINVSSFFRLEETWDQIPQDVQETPLLWHHLLSASKEKPLLLLTIHAQKFAQLVFEKHKD